VHEEGCQAALHSTSVVQELKERLKAERAWWSKTSAAKVTSQLDQERAERASDVAQLKHDLEAQQVTLAEIAGRLLGGLEVPTGSQQEPAVTQAVAAQLEASVGELRAAQDLQAGALREGLMEIHQQRTALSKAGDHLAEECRARASELRDAVDALRDSLGSRIDEMTEELARDRKAREGQLVGPEATPAERAARARELADLHSAEGPGAKALELHAQLAEELADVIRRSEKHRAELAQAIEVERVARMGEAADLRAAVAASSERSSEHRVLVGAKEPCGDPDLNATLRREFEEERDQRLREAADSKIYMENMMGAAIERTEQLEQKLIAAKREWDLRPDVPMGDVMKLAEEILAMRANVQRLDDALARERVERATESSQVRSQVGDLAARGARREVEDERLRELAEHMMNSNEERASASRQLAALLRRFEASETRASALQQEVTACTKLSRDAAIVLSRIEATEASVASLRQEFAALESGEDQTSSKIKFFGVPVDAESPGGLGGGAVPRTDTDELATRLEAIKAQLRAEIEKRIERAPPPALLGAGEVAGLGDPAAPAAPS